MTISAPAILRDKWPLFVKYGLTEKCVYQSMGPSQSDMHMVTKVPISTHNVDIIFDKIKDEKIDNSTVRSIDRWAIFPSLSLPVGAKVYDLIVDESLREWEVLSVVEDPAGAHYELWVRPIT